MTENGHSSLGREAGHENVREIDHGEGCTTFGNTLPTAKMNQGWDFMVCGLYLYF